MDYTEIDPAAEADAVLAANAVEQLWVAYSTGIDAAALAWCAGIAACTGSGDEGEHATEQAEAAAAIAADATERAATLTARIVSKKVRAGIADAVNARMSEWLPLYIATVEREHAQHAALLEVVADDEQAVEHRLNMLRCEAGQRAALT